MISVSAAVREATGLRGGDFIKVTLTVVDTPRDVVVPADLGRALEANQPAQAFFNMLSNSVQRLHVDNVNGAKTERRVSDASTRPSRFSSKGGNARDTGVDRGA